MHNEGCLIHQPVQSLSGILSASRKINYFEEEKILDVKITGDSMSIFDINKKNSLFFSMFNIKGHPAIFLLSNICKLDS